MCILGRAASGGEDRQDTRFQGQPNTPRNIRRKSARNTGTYISMPQVDARDVLASSLVSRTRPEPLGLYFYVMLPRRMQLQFVSVYMPPVKQQCWVASMNCCGNTAEN